MTLYFSYCRSMLFPCVALSVSVPCPFSGCPVPCLLHSTTEQNHQARTIHLFAQQLCNLSVCVWYCLVFFLVCSHALARDSTASHRDTDALGMIACLFEYLDMIVYLRCVHVSVYALVFRVCISACVYFSACVAINVYLCIPTSVYVCMLAVIYAIGVQCNHTRMSWCLHANSTDKITKTHSPKHVHQKLTTKQNSPLP